MLVMLLIIFVILYSSSSKSYIYYAHVFSNMIVMLSSLIFFSFSCLETIDRLATVYTCGFICVKHPKTQKYRFSKCLVRHDVVRAFVSFCV